ncbi:pyridoxamine 5'-phosphate oxidase family protein [Aliamphritea hakodatensis]|uniref:pyridoxamine 5'-phosphate oxidase family protein n=1 Tax=Aliamphritea hakodatensis TaxID=2895352 RepID=UPI0022FD91A6|nr:pyridoxamine 5'-phosphate oxidase family protein [Aliamphritea hakodatensis]
MGHRFAEIAFTESVLAEQQRHGSGEAYQGFLGGEDFNGRLSAAEAGFIQARDSFYMASVSETGWPYVQHRGGAAGFVRVLDKQTLGFADYSGNRQYVSLGNFRRDNRVALFFMDYANRTRLKLLGRIRLVDPQNLKTLAALEQADFRAPVERGYLIDVEGFDWNCPKYITPRFTEQEWQALATPEVSAAVPDQPVPVPDTVLGDGPLELKICGVSQLTSEVRSYQLQSVNGEPLPAFSPGAHVQLPVPTPQGIRMGHYSLCGAPDSHEYQIAVQAKADSTLAAALQCHYQLGTRLQITEPLNYFALHEDNRPALLIAGGIGITPLKSMALALLQRGADFQLHYAAKRPEQMAFYPELQSLLGERLITYFSHDGERLNPAELLTDLADDCQIYACGPEELLASIRRATRNAGVADRLMLESF